LYVTVGQLHVQLIPNYTPPGKHFIDKTWYWRKNTGLIKTQTEHRLGACLTEHSKLCVVVLCTERESTLGSTTNQHQQDSRKPNSEVGIQFDSNRNRTIIYTYIHDTPRTCFDLQVPSSGRWLSKDRLGTAKNNVLTIRPTTTQYLLQRHTGQTIITARRRHTRYG